MSLFAKWSIVGLVCLGTFFTLTKSFAKKQDGPEIAGTFVALSIHAWYLIAILVWWHT